MFNLRIIAGAVVFSLTGAAAVMATSLPSAKVQHDGACASATWPNIPANCLEGATATSVRLVTTDRVATNDLPDRFAVAFALPQSGAVSATLR